MNAAADQVQPFARIIDVSEDEYHRDPCETPSLNQTVAHEIVSKSPLHGWTIHPRLGKQQEVEVPEKETKDTLAGKVIHRLLLGTGATLDVLDFPDYRTNRAKDARDEAKTAGRLPVLAHYHEEFLITAELLRDKLAARGIVFDGRSEVAFEWYEDGERGPVLCRGRMDHVKPDRPQIIDVKKIVSAHPLTITRHMYEYGYDIQWRAYTSCVGKFVGCDPDDVDYLLAFVEINPPFATTIVDMRKCGAYCEIGRMRWDRAVLLWERCLATNRWPEYMADNEPLGVEPMPWVMNQEIGSGNW